MQVISDPDTIELSAAVPTIGAQSVLDQIAEWLAAHPENSGAGVDPFALAHAYDVAHPGAPLAALPPADQIDPFAQWWAAHHTVEVVGAVGGAPGFGM